MKYLLDTKTCISHLRKPQSRVTEELAARAPQDVVICSVVKAELIFGARRSNATAKNLAILAAFFSGFVSLPFDDLAAMEYGETRDTLYRAGTPIGPHDLTDRCHRRIARAHPGHAQHAGVRSRAAPGLRGLGEDPVACGVQVVRSVESPDLCPKQLMTLS